MLSLQCFLLKCFAGPLLVHAIPGHPGKGYWHFIVVLGNLNLYTLGGGVQVFSLWGIPPVGLRLCWV